MGCGCKKNRKKKSIEGESTSKLIKEQKDYRNRVGDAMKQFFDLKRRKSSEQNS